MNKAAWASFWILGFIWGSSFLLIRIGVEELSATQLVFIRIIIGAIGLNAVRIYKGKSLPKDWKTIRAFILIGIGNATIPYTLISLGEQNISSGMAAVLQATASLFTLVIAHYALSDERMTPQKIGGLVVGFLGVIVLSLESIDGGKIDTPMILGQLAIILASLFYAIFVTYSKKIITQKIDPIVISSGTFIYSAIGAAVFVVLEPVFGGRAWVPLSEVRTDIIYATLGLGFVNTFIAYLFFYFIIQQLGAFRASMVTYVVPAVGMILGWLILHEHIAITMLIGAIMIFTGIGIVNIHPQQLRKYLGRSPEPAEAM